MKIRSGFVSNSSSSSFLIFGACLEEDEIRKAFGWRSVEEDEESEDGPLDTCNELDELEIPYWPPNDCYEQYFLGLSLADCRDDETMGDFKRRVIATVNEKTKTPIEAEKFAIHEECWFS